MILKNDVWLSAQARRSGAAKIAQKLFDQGEPLTAIHRYLTQKAGFNHEMSLIIIKHLDYDSDTD